MTVPSRRRLLVASILALSGVRLAGIVADGCARELTRAPPAWAVPVRIDLNRARVGELATLPSIGPARAAAIVLERVRHGRFDAVEDLARVGGIGAATIDELRPYAVVGGAAASPR